MVRRKNESNCAPVTDGWLLADIWIGFNSHSEKRKVIWKGQDTQAAVLLLFPRIGVLDMRP